MTFLKIWRFLTPNFEALAWGRSVKKIGLKLCNTEIVSTKNELCSLLIVCSVFLWSWMFVRCDSGHKSHRKIKYSKNHNSSSIRPTDFVLVSLCLELRGLSGYLLILYALMKEKFHFGYLLLCYARDKEPLPKYAGIFYLTS